MNKIKTGVIAFDKLAYHLVCNWHKEVDFNPVRDGIDVSLIIRFYLWDKVGRAIRIANRIDLGEEKAYAKETTLYPFYHTPFIANGNYKRKWLSRKKILFMPFRAPKSLVNILGAHAKVKIISKDLQGLIADDQIIISPQSSSNETWAGEMFLAIEKALMKYEFQLVDQDKLLLKEQINGAIAITDLAEKELREYSPNGVFVHSDNHPPFINYVLVANKLDIPTFTYQHGLDCEHYYLDDSFADFVGVWSENRKSRYLSDSESIAKEYRVVGNFLLAANQPNTSLKTNVEVLYVSRPHKPIKCYSPSRNHMEGEQIVEALLLFLKNNKEVRLTIKPHPMDASERYVDLIENEGLENRVTITNKTLAVILQDATIVVTEDSTAGAEAMKHHITVVHAHFAKSTPVLPFVSYKSALPGFNSIQLLDSMDKAMRLSEEEKILFAKNQDAFCEDFIPRGNVNEMANFIVENLK
jgi:hypothetical protein